LLLIRHGHTEATEKGRLYTDPLAELTEVGVEQSKKLAAWMKENRPDLIISSTAKRVTSTATIIGDAINVDPISVNGLEEWHVGEWEGRSYLDIKKNEPELYKTWSSDPIVNRPPGGESISDVCVRVNKRIEELVAEYDGKKIALVTHAGVIRAILVQALGMSVHNFWRLSIPVGSVSRVDFSKSFATVYFVSFTPGM